MTQCVRAVSKQGLVKFVATRQSTFLSKFACSPTTNVPVPKTVNVEVSILFAAMVSAKKVLQIAPASVTPNARNRLNIACRAPVNQIRPFSAPQTLTVQTHRLPIAAIH